MAIKYLAWFLIIAGGVSGMVGVVVELVRRAVTNGF